ncbi:RING finger domain-containing protein [Cardinium endosymbiont of Philonthus spinipes]|uniref:RING finger domain-containing protein n=1 Tax=Cardinium endosymbiont of Philonthus spinipes TaxID=3077941 RepID=UPI00313C27FA
MQSTIYSNYLKQLVAIFMLFGLIVFSGGCLKTMEAARPVSCASSCKLEVCISNGKRILQALTKAMQKKSNLKQCCGHTSDRCLLENNTNKDALLFVLDKHMQALTEEEKADIEEVIIKLSCDAISPLKNAGVTLVEIVEDISEQLGIHAKKGKQFNLVEGDQNGLGECVLCLCDLKGSLTVLPCHHTHVFHKDCIKQWVRSEVPPPPRLCQWCLKIFYLFHKPTCPICRQPFNPNKLD